jgi:hypothetical protein
MENHGIDKLNKLLLDIYVTSRKKTNKKALKYINTMMFGVVIDTIEKYFNVNAKKYIVKRDKKNKKLKKNVDKMMKTLDKHINTSSVGSKIKFIVMSSYKAGLNLIDGSDIDIGCVVENLDTIKLFKISLLLVEQGFSLSGMFVNKHDEKNKYFSFEKVVDGIEYEVKVRDAADSAIIIKLDKMVEKKLTNKQKCLFTYAKEITKGTDGYKYMKLFIAESVFYYIDGAYMFT